MLPDESFGADRRAEDEDALEGLVVVVDFESAVEGLAQSLGVHDGPPETRRILDEGEVSCRDFVYEDAIGLHNVLNVADDTAVVVLQRFEVEAEVDALEERVD